MKKTKVDKDRINGINGAVRKTAVILSLLMLLSACGTHKSDGTDRITDNENTTAQTDILTSNDGAADETTCADTADTTIDIPYEEETTAPDEDIKDTETDTSTETGDTAEAGNVTEDGNGTDTDITGNADITDSTGNSANGDVTSNRDETSKQDEEPKQEVTAKPDETTKNEPAAHKHSYTSKVTTAATCGKDGTKTYTCSCGKTYTETIKATGKHSYTSKVTTAATCGKDGTKTYTCSCGDTYTETIKATGKHSYTSKVTTAATCGKDGTKTYTCGTCGKTYTETIKATGKHNYVDTVVEPKYYYDGYTQHDCNVCGDSYKDSYVEKGVFTKYRNLMKTNRYEAIKTYFEEKPCEAVNLETCYRYLTNDEQTLLYNIVFCNPIYTTKPFDIEAIKADMIGFGDYLGQMKHVEKKTYIIDGKKVELTPEPELGGTWFDPVWLKGEKNPLWSIILDYKMYHASTYTLCFKEAPSGDYAIYIIH